MEESRTQNTIRNVRTGAVVQLINKLMAFVVRTVFIKMLNSEYLGVNGLFTNILTMLSFTELGIGTAIIFNMYKPVAENDKEKIKSLMKLYKKAYTIIGIIIFLLGLCVIPFMRYMIKEVPNIKENIIVIYLLFLIDTSVSYFFTYKKSLILAHQKQSIINNIDSIFYLIRSLLVIIFLVITKNYIVYLVIQVLGTFIENIVLAKKSDKLYPYLKEKNVKQLDKSVSKNILNNVKSLVVYQFGVVIMSGTDNILISSIVNVNTVGLCSNYTMIVNSIKSIITSALSGVTASVGNLNAIGDSKQKEKVFYQLTFVNYIIYSFCALAFMLLLNPFIQLWLGDSYILSISVPIALAVSFFIDGLRAPGYTYRTTLGLFEKGKITPYIGAITNIFVSILLGRLLGVAGIFIATSIAQLISYSWIDPFLIHKYEFKTSVKRYFKKYINYILAFILNILVSFGITNLINLQSIAGFALKMIVVVVVPNVLNLLIFYKTEEFIEVKERFIRPIINKLLIKFFKR